MRLALVAAVLALVGGCKELNPSYCAEHREDPDCLTEGVTLLDAPASPECTSDLECATNVNKVCDVEAGRCVECIESASCPAMQVCGTDQMCVGCVTDGDCASSVCLPSQTCAAAQDVLYANPTGTGTACSSAEPCTFSSAVGQLTAQRHIIKLLVIPNTSYTDPTITIDEPFGVQIIAKSVTFVPSGGGGGIIAAGANLEVLGLTLQGAGVRCTAGVLTLDQMTIADTPDFGVVTDNCNTNIKRSRISGSPAGAISVGAGTHEIRNNIVHDNGNPNLETGAIFVRGARGRAAFNTIVRTQSRSGGGGRVGGIACTEASAGAFAVAQNIIAAWGNANVAIGGDCTVRENYTTQNLADVRFVSATDFHLTAQSPAGLVLDSQTPATAADCTGGDGQHIDDVDGQARPFNNFCDRGADEHRP